MTELDADERSTLPVALDSLLRRLDAGTSDDREVLAEALREMANRVGARYRLPSTLLVALLDTPPSAGRDERLQTLAGILSREDAAFVALRPEWERRLARHGGSRSDPGSDDDHQVWQMGTHARRLALLSRLRQDEPARAAEFLADASIAKEPLKQRVELLETLRVGVGEHDRELLTGLLEGRSKVIRTLAADLLGSVPSSVVVEAAEQAAVGHLSVNRSVNRAGFLERLRGHADSATITVAARGVADTPELARLGFGDGTSQQRLCGGRIPT